MAATVADPDIWNALPAAHARLLRRLFEAFSAQDVAAAMELLHPDFVLELPFEPGAPCVDKAGFAAILSRLRAHFARWDLSVFDALCARGEDRVVLRYCGAAVSADGRLTYRNSYLGVFTIVAGSVLRLVEFPNPVLTDKLSRDLRARALAAAATEARAISALDTGEPPR